jgi:Flp pilus assembly protein TadG
MCTESNEKGVAAVEFVLILPMLLLVLYIIIEFSIILYDKAVITNASREGARMGIVYQPVDVPRPGAGAIEATVNNYCASNLISFSTAVPVTSVSAACVNSGDLLTVNVIYPYSFFVLPKFSGLFGINKSVTGGSTGLTLTGHTVMRCE